MPTMTKPRRRSLYTIWLMPVLAVAISAFALGGCSSSGALPGAGRLRAVGSLDVDRYLGRWYEIARYPTSFQRRLVGVTTDYELRSDGSIRMTNSGYVGALDGKLKAARAKAWVPSSEEPAKLQVQFVWPVRTKHWIIARDEEYQWAVVGEPKRRRLRVLSRTPTMDPALLSSIRSQITSLGYDDERLVATEQPNGPVAHEPVAGEAGLIVDDLFVGEGRALTQTSSIFATMVGRIEGGDVFQRLNAPEEPWPVSDLIPGMMQGLDGMREGGRRRITIPPELAYGAEAITDEATGAVLIPANATIIYEVQLIEVRETGEGDER